MVYTIEAKSIKEARFKAVNLIVNKGSIIRDQRGELTKEVLNLIISIPAENCELPEDPLQARLGIDFANGLVDDDIAEARGEGFEYAYGWELREDGALWDTRRILQGEPETRRAYIPIFRLRHVGQEDIPCFVGLDFIIRNGGLHLTAFSRSNENAIAMQNDIYGFSQLQKWMASEIDVDLGIYTQHVVSAHVRINSEADLIKKILKDGY